MTASVTIAPRPTRRDILLAGASLPLSAARGIEAGRLTDLMPSFWRIADSSSSPTVVAERLWRGFFQPRAALYQRAGIPLARERFARWLPELRQSREAIREVSNRLPAALGRHEIRFRSRLPSYDPSGTETIILPSLGAFDGHLEPDGARLPLFLAPDGIVRYHGRGADLDVLLDHEAFHLLQAQARPELSLDQRPPLFINLWLEGVATYASRVLNPSASLLHVLLNDRRLAEATPDEIEALAHLALARIDDGSDDTIGLFFSASSGGQLPARGGYLLGMLVAERASRAVPLDRLATLQREKIRALVAAELEQLLA